MTRDLEAYANDELAERINATSDTAEFLLAAIDDVENEFDLDSYAPYTRQEVEMIDEYDREFGNDAEDLCDGIEYPASEWGKARRAYAQALGYTAYGSYLQAAKDAASEAIEEFNEELESLGVVDAKIHVTLSDNFGWQTPTRVDASTYYFEGGQLDGLNGISMECAGFWLSCAYDPSKLEDEDAA